MLDWELQWGSSVDSLLEMKQAHGFTPKALLNRVPLRFDCLAYKQAFYKLSGQRAYNQTGPIPIPISEIAVLLKARGIDDEDDVETYLDAIPAMDAVYLEHIRKRMESASKS